MWFCNSYHTYYSLYVGADYDFDGDDDAHNTATSDLKE